PRRSRRHSGLPGIAISRSSAPLSPGRRSKSTSSTHSRSMWLRSSPATGPGSSTCRAGAGSPGSSRRSIRRTRAVSGAPTVPKGLALPPPDVPQDPHRLVVEVLAGVDGRGPVVDLGVQLLHPSVELVGGVGRLGELVDQPVGDVAVELVVDLVLQAGPEV